MNILNCEHDFSDQERGYRKIKDFSFAKMEGQITSRAQVKDHIQIVWGLKRIVQLKHIGMVRFFKDICLTDSILQVIVFDKEIFSQNLHSITFFRFRFQAYFEHFTKSSLTKNFLDCKWFERDSNLGIVIKSLVFCRLETFCFFHLRRRDTFQFNLWSFRALIFVSAGGITVC